MTFDEFIFSYTQMKTALREATEERAKLNVALREANQDKQILKDELAIVRGSCSTLNPYVKKIEGELYRAQAEVEHLRIATENHDWLVSDRNAERERANTAEARVKRLTAEVERLRAPGLARLRADLMSDAAMAAISGAEAMVARRDAQAPKNTDDGAYKPSERVAEEMARRYAHAPKFDKNGRRLSFAERILAIEKKLGMWNTQY